MLGSLAAPPFQVLIFTTLLWLPKHPPPRLFSLNVLPSESRAISEHTNCKISIRCWTQQNIVYVGRGPSIQMYCNQTGVKSQKISLQEVAGDHLQSNAADFSDSNWMGKHVGAAVTPILVLTLSSDVWKKRSRARKQRRRDRLGEQSSASKEETESVIKEKRINEFTSCKKQQTAHVLESCSGRGGSEWLMLSFFLTPVRLFCQCVRFIYRVVSLKVIITKN